jgi:2',5'-phosphodiesterase
MGVEHGRGLGGGGESLSVLLLVQAGQVGRGPVVTAGFHRHALTAAPLPPTGLRVVTYNILADQYAASDYARSVLFSYCPQQ